jgi:hypothetical protein
MKTQPKASAIDWKFVRHKLLLGLPYVSSNFPPETPFFLSVFQQFAKLFQETTNRPPLMGEISEWEMLSILEHEIRVVVSNANAPLPPGQTIGALIPATDLAGVADRVIAIFKGIPYDYEVLFDVHASDRNLQPTSVGWNAGALTIASGIELLHPQFEAALLATLGLNIRDPSQRFLRISTRGFYGNDAPGSGAIRKAENKLAHFLQLGLYTGISTQNPIAFALGRGMIQQPNRQGLVFSKSSPLPPQSYFLRKALSDALASAMLDERLLVGGAFQAVAHLFDEDANPVNYEPIQAALEWAAAAQSRENDTFSLVQTCIALEAILGDEKQDSVGRRLADRCSYLLGKSREERRALTDKFDRIYSARSKLVHGRKRQLSKEDYETFPMAQEILRDVVLAELKNLKP